MSKKTRQIIATCLLAFMVIGVPIMGKFAIDAKERREAEEFERLRPTETVAAVTNAPEPATADTADRDWVFMPGENIDFEAKARREAEKNAAKDARVNSEEKGIEIVISDKDVSEQAVIVSVPEATEDIVPLVAVNNVPVSADTGELPESFFESKEAAAEAIENIPAGDTVTMELPTADGSTANIDFAKVTQVAYYPLKWDDWNDEWTTSGTAVYHTVEEAKNNPIDGMVLFMGEYETDSWGNTGKILYTYDKFSGKWIRSFQMDFDEIYTRYNPETQRVEWISFNGSWDWTSKATLRARGDLVLDGNPSPEYRGIADDWDFQ